MPLILASNSPRRRFLLSLLGLDFTVQAADVDETMLPGELPSAYVLRLARAKAMVCAKDGNMTLAADTAVVDGEAILGKPRDAMEAAEMLRRLRGRAHHVYTALALWTGARLLTDLCVTEVFMREYSEEEIARYIASGDPLDKAGAYAIQHADFRPAAAVQGCYACVVGLPLCHLVRLLRRAGLDISATDIPTHCQSAFNYSCSVYPLLLHEERTTTSQSVSLCNQR